MKAITISQPYASLIAEGQKFVENRTWPTRYRGPIAIHAGKGTQYLTKRELAEYPSGCIVAEANLVDCVHLQEVMARNPEDIVGLAGVTVGQLLQHEHTEGPWCWILKDIRKLETPKPIVGKQGLWDFYDREWESRFDNG